MKSAHNLGRKKWVYELKEKYERNYVKYLEKRYGKERAVHFACQNT